ncbi:MAG TPA: hypothetical protein VLF90_02575 [Patescibacteria group bacterium]|nr:hypothetical protein [Patescibacteria group bacterium]
MIKPKPIFRIGSCSLLVWVALILFALNPIVLAAASIAQGYRSNLPLTTGTVVSVKSGNEVVPTTEQNQKTVIGVAVGSSDAIIDVQPHDSDIRIAINGETSLVVSNINGDIKAGDSLIISSISGVAMKDSRDSQATKYIAVANQDFTSKSQNAKTVSISLNDGTKQNVSIGVIDAKLLLTNRTPVKNQNILFATAEKLAGRPVSNVQILAASAVIIATLLLTGLLLQGSIKGAFISIGRNPLSKPMIVANLFKVLAVGLLIMGAGLAISYSILLA